jgi:hypothetical protein
MFFLLFLLDDRRIRIREAQKHMDPTDPDPQHWKAGTDFLELQNNCSAHDSIPFKGEWSRKQKTHLLQFGWCAGAAEELREAGAAGLQLL